MSLQLVTMDNDGENVDFATENIQFLAASGTPSNNSGARIHPKKLFGKKSKEDQEHDKVGPSRKVMFRWSLEDDLILVKQVEGELPFNLDKGNPQKWNKIATAINSMIPNCGVDGLGVRRRIERLLSSFRKQDLKNRFSSGKEETVKPLEQKLAALAEFQESVKQEAREAAANQQKKDDEAKAMGDNIRNAALTTILKRKCSDELPNKRASEKSMLQLYQESQELERSRFDRKFELKSQELEFEKEKFQHQRHKEEAELRIREQQHELEKQERKAMIETQRLMLEMLAKKL